MLSSKYIQAAVTNIKNYYRLHFPNYQWSKRTSGPFPTNYVQELKTAPELIPGHMTFYQSQVWLLHWSVEFGCIDTMTAVYELASYLAMPGEGYVEAIFHLFNYLEKN
jgi:hypothetical protein